MQGGTCHKRASGSTLSLHSSPRHSPCGCTTLFSSTLFHLHHPYPCPTYDIPISRTDTQFGTADEESARDPVSQPRRYGGTRRLFKRHFVQHSKSLTASWRHRLADPCGARHPQWKQVHKRDGNSTRARNLHRFPCYPLHRGDFT